GPRGAVVGNGGIRVLATPAADEFGGSSFAAGEIVQRLRSSLAIDSARVVDESGRASGALTWNLTLAPHALAEVDVTAPIGRAPGSPPTPPFDASSAARAQSETERTWAARLGSLKLRLPADVEQTLEAQRGWILMQRDSAAFEPGSRSYARSWIRDGSLMSTALLRCGIDAPVRDYLRWFATRQFDNGKVPCCVDARGPDPTPEHDSDGEF